MPREISAADQNAVHNFACFVIFLALACAFCKTAHAQDGATAPLREVHVEGEKHLHEEQIVALTTLAPGAQVGKQELQSAADKLVATGLFAKVNYNFSSKTDGVYVTYHVEENPSLPA